MLIRVGSTNIHSFFHDDARQFGYFDALGPCGLKSTSSQKVKIVKTIWHIVIFFFENLEKKGENEKDWIGLENDNNNRKSRESRVVYESVE